MKAVAVVAAALTGVASAGLVDTFGRQPRDNAPVEASSSSVAGLMEVFRRQSGSQSTTGGLGPYGPLNYTFDSSLPTHTIYIPKKVPDGVKLPIVVWGEGGCAANGLAFNGMLTNWASHGFVILASGPPRGNGSTTSKYMSDAITWISSKAGSGAYAAADPTRISAAGMSCGGLEAYDMNENAKVSYIGIFNSGYRQNTTAIARIKKPVFFFLGGPSDIAYENGERDYKGLPAGTPSWKGNINVGHGGTYSKPEGGVFGNAGLHWIQWTLQANTTAAKYFTADGAKADGWAYESKDLDKLKVLG